MVASTTHWVGVAWTNRARPSPLLAPYDLRTQTAAPWWSGDAPALSINNNYFQSSVNREREREKRLAHTLPSISPKNNKASGVLKALLYNTRWKRTLHQHNLIREIHINTLNAYRPGTGRPSSNQTVNYELNKIMLFDLGVHSGPASQNLHKKNSSSELQTPSRRQSMWVDWRTIIMLAINHHLCIDLSILRHVRAHGGYPSDLIH